MQLSCLRDWVSECSHPLCSIQAILCQRRPAHCFGGRTPPGANWEVSGRSGCHDFACTCATAASLDNLIVCPGAGEEAMKNCRYCRTRTKHCQTTGSSTQMLWYMREQTDDRQATTGRHRVPCYTPQAQVPHRVAFGCLGCGDCVKACRFGAMYMDPVTGLPAIDRKNAPGCGRAQKYVRAI